jgi:DNA repair protein SbcC/Rad50
VLTDLIIINFQSVKLAQLRLGRFTVITGPTGSGKSAVVRALALAAFNKRGSQFVTRGATAPCKVVVGDADDKWAVAITRGRTTAKDSYRVNYIVPTPVKDGEGVSGAAYTKLAGGVPPQVSELLRITELCFARQLDRPYLLDESGGQIARTLGELTNVTVVFDAAREGNRQRLEVMRDLKRAEKDIETITEQLQQYADLPARRSAVAAAAHALTAATALSGRLDRLRALRSTLQSAREEVAAHEAALPVPPSLEAAEALRARLTLLHGMHITVIQAKASAALAAEQAEKAKAVAQAAHKELHDSLVAAGKCPMCGQAVNEWTQLASIVSQP